MMPLYKAAIFFLHQRSMSKRIAWLQLQVTPRTIPTMSPSTGSKTISNTSTGSCHGATRLVPWECCKSYSILPNHEHLPRTTHNWHQSQAAPHNTSSTSNNEPGRQKEIWYPIRLFSVIVCFPFLPVTFPRRYCSSKSELEKLRLLFSKQQCVTHCQCGCVHVSCTVMDATALAADKNGPFWSKKVFPFWSKKTSLKAPQPAGLMTSSSAKITAGFLGTKNTSRTCAFRSRPPWAYKSEVLPPTWPHNWKKKRYVSIFQWLHIFEDTSKPNDDSRTRSSTQ